MKTRGEIQKEKDDKQHLIFIFLLAILIRLPIAYVTTGASFDIESYNLVGRNILQGNLNPYYSGRYPYPPFWMFFEALAVWTSDITGIPLYFVAKLIPVIFDAGIAVVIFKILNQQNNSEKHTNIYLTLIYIFNPISLLIIAGHGQFDSIPLFFLLLAIYYFTSHRLTCSSLSLGMGIFAKIYPILALPFFISKIENTRKKIKYFIFSLIICTISLLPYIISTPQLLIKEVFLYSSTSDFGYSSIVRNIIWFTTGSFDLSYLISQLGKILILTGVGGLWYYYRHRLPIEKLIVAIFLAFYVLSAGIGAQYLLWVVPFAVISREKLLKYYFLLGTGALIGFYLLLFPGAIGLPNHFIQTYYSASIYSLFNIFWWLFCVYWLLKMTIKSVRNNQMIDRGDDERYGSEKVRERKINN